MLATKDAKTIVAVCGLGFYAMLGDSFAIECFVMSVLAIDGWMMMLCAPMMLRLHRVEVIIRFIECEWCDLLKASSNECLNCHGV